MKKRKELTVPKGFMANGVSAGLAKRGKRDVALFYSEVPCNAAGMFTVNRVKAAPVMVSRKNLQSGRAKAIAVNSGCANACTGKKGLKDAEMTTGYLSEIMGIRQSEVLVASTGLIGSFLEMSRLKAGLKRIAAGFKRGESDFNNAAKAIMTTDTKIKVAGEYFTLGGKRVAIWAAAKGAGMIHPRLATMLAFLLTDAAVSPGVLRKSLRDAVRESFHSITVDGDTSTNDSVMILANGSAGNGRLNGRDSRRWTEKLKKVCSALSRMIIEDAEGATKRVEIEIVHGSTKKDAQSVAETIARSPLFKTAIYGNSTNWGRIMCAVGNSGAKIDPARTDVYFGKLRVVKGGIGSGYDEGKAAKLLSKKDVKINVDL